jgi:hypothetical protein
MLIRRRGPAGPARQGYALGGGHREPPGMAPISRRAETLTDTGERATLEAILAKEPPGTDPLAMQPVCSLNVIFGELGAMLVGATEGDLEPGPE